MNDARNEINNAYNLLAALPVRGDAVDVVAACRMALRRALELMACERLWKDHVQLDKCIASLDEDGLIEILPGGGVRLPV